MSLTLDPYVATQVSTTLDELSTTMSSNTVAAPSGFDWSQGPCDAAQLVITDTMQQLANIVGNIAANTADCAAGFEKYDDMVQEAMSLGKVLQYR